MYKKIKYITLFAVLIGHTVPAEAAFSFDSISGFFSRNKAAIFALGGLFGLSAFTLWYIKKPSAQTAFNAERLPNNDYSSFDEIEESSLIPGPGKLNCPTIIWKNLYKIHDQHKFCPIAKKHNIFFVKQPRLSLPIYEAENKLTDRYKYKIHLMPSQYNLETIRAICTIINREPTLYNNILSFKFRTHGGTDIKENGSKIPLVIIYPEPTFRRDLSFEENLEATKNTAQQLLNKLFELTKDIEGSGIRPRYNAEVNKLIWVAQGGGDDKDDARGITDPGLTIHDRYVGPEFIYSNLTFDPLRQKTDEERIEMRWIIPKENTDNRLCYLYHPETGTPLISGQKNDPILIDPAAPASSHALQGKL